MRHWIKLWTEMLDDPKMGRLSDRQHRLCINLFCLAGLIDDDGRLLSTADIAYKVRRDADSVAEDLQALAAVNIIEQNGDTWQLVHFEARNERPPSAEPEAVKERVSRYREKQRDGNEAVTSLQSDVTSPQRGVTASDQIRSDQTRSDPDQIRPATDTDAMAAVVAALAPAGISESTVKKKLPGWEHPEHATAVVRLADNTRGIKNRAGFILSKLDEGWEPPRQAESRDPPEPEEPEEPPDTTEQVPGWPGMIKTQLDPSTYASWFVSSKARLVDGKIVISLPSGRALEWVEHRLRPTVERALAGYGRSILFEAAG